jgi:copper oxidase (laccase) domain-containing protein
VGEDVRQRFLETGTNDDSLSRWFLAAPAPSDRNPSMPMSNARRNNRWFFDGWRAVAEQLQLAGVPECQMFSAGLCTASHPDVFCSYRRDGGSAGRQVGVIRSARRRP